jgi:hypothetical protein
VHAVSRKLRSSRDERLRWWQTDLGQVAAVRELWQATRPEIVFHLASHVAGARAGARTCTRGRRGGGRTAGALDSRVTQW